MIMLTHTTGLSKVLALTRYMLNLEKIVCVSDLEEVGEKLENYASLQQFFVRSLKAGCRPLDPNPSCLVTGILFLVSLS